MRAKRHAVFGHFAQVAQAEYLEATRVGEDGVVPGHELLHATQLAHHLDAGPEIEMVGIVQQHLDAEFFERVLRDALYRGQSAYGHEDGRLYLAVWREEEPGTRLAFARLNLKAERH